MLGMVEIESISSSLRAGQSPALSNGVYSMHYAICVP